MRTLLQDIRHALRCFLRWPSFSVVVIVTLALGIGANAAVFTVVDGVLLRPLPYRDPERLMMIWGRMSSADMVKAPWSGPDLLDFRDQAGSFSGFAAAAGFNSTLTGDFEPEPIQMGIATTNFFELLGARPELGRSFNADDQQNLDPQVFSSPDAAPPPGVAILSYEVWERRYGLDPNVIDKRIRVGGQPVTVVGVAPKGFKLHLPPEAAMPARIDVWVAMATDLSKEARDQQWLTVLGRLKKGATQRQAQFELNDIAARLRDENRFHANAGMEIEAVPMLEDAVGHVRPALQALWGAVGFVLLIACANVSNLLLLRSHAMRRNIAIRAALGGSRARIVRQMLTESALLALAAGVVGLFLGSVGVDLLLTLRPDDLPRIEEVRLDGSIAAVVLAASLAATMLFGLLPALHASKPDLAVSLRQRRQGAEIGRFRILNAMVAAEVALSLILLIGTGLMLRSFSNLERVEPGFDPEGVLTLNVSLPSLKYRDPGSGTALHSRLRREIEALPGVVAVGAVTPLPLAGGGQNWFGPYAAGQAEDEEWRRNEGDYRPSLPGLFRAMGTRLIAGRALNEEDNRADARPVAVVDEKLARRLWPAGALGKRLSVLRSRQGSFEKYQAEVVGVVEHVRYDDLRREGRETIYFPHSAWEWTDLNYVIRSSLDSASLSRPIRQIIRRLDPDIPVATPMPLGSFMDRAMASTRFALVLITVFATIALVLSSVGLYGVISSAVRQRTQEIALRMALGAARRRILGKVMAQGLLITSIGLAVGLFGSLLATRAVSSLLFGVSPADPVTYAAFAAVLSAVALTACYLPAARATRVEPIDALRTE